ncbi:MAG TPA: O-antigen ligase domain-containing protein [Phycisphaerae bacterium]|jgi:hypothetical protein
MESSLVIIVLFGWIPVVLLLFSVIPARRAVIAAFLTAWLFLPMAAFKLAPGIPHYDKMNATCLGVLLASLVFDTRRFLSFRPIWIDIPMALWCCCPMASSLSNELGFYDGMSAVFYQTVTWGLPYLIGRLYFPDLASLKELAIGIFIGGLIYVPLCLWEIRMSPQLHNWIYGFQQHDFVQTMRFGGYRPMVFMQHGLMVGMWMCMTALIGFWLWYSGALRTIRRVPMAYLVPVLLITAILCKSVGAIVLLGLGIVAIVMMQKMRYPLVIWLLILAAPSYMAARASGVWDGSLLSTAAQNVAADRADSLDYRMKNEDLLAAKALKRPAFGWGTWGRSRIYDEYGKDVAATDGLWIIALGSTGIIGLASWTIAMLLPTSLLFLNLRASAWREPLIAPPIILGVVVVLYVLDCIPNGMVNPIFTVCVGGLASLSPQSFAAFAGKDELLSGAA